MRGGKDYPTPAYRYENKRKGRFKKETINFICYENKPVDDLKMRIVLISLKMVYSAIFHTQNGY
ncbi:hypothetical protein ASF92_12475 [Pedobacter sp. Leaf176]|nr:hypothetical protein ASF92_12475 [Pedobacter sp. Leaf176]